MLLKQDFNTNTGVFGMKSDRLLGNSSEKGVNEDLISRNSELMDFKNDHISSIIG